VRSGRVSSESGVGAPGGVRVGGARRCVARAGRPAGLAPVVYGRGAWRTVAVAGNRLPAPTGAGTIDRGGGGRGIESP